MGAVFLWGAVISAGGAFIINSVFGISIYVLTGSETASNLTTSALIAPFIEEILKGIAVLLVFIFYYQEFDSFLDGILYAGIAALGFAATENTYYIYTFGFLEQGWQGFKTLSIIRLGLVGWQHPFYSAFFGIGLATARLNQNRIVRFTAPFIGLGLAMASHAIHNILATFFQGIGGISFSTIIDWIGWLMMLGFIFIAMRIEQSDLVINLKDEVELQNLTNSQYQTAVSGLKVSSSRIKSIFQGNYQKTTLLYRTAAKLALKKKQFKRLGDEKDNVATIKALREAVRNLSKSL